MFRRKRKGKGAKGRARSGGRANQKGLKLQGKAPLPSPTTCSLSTKLPIAVDNQTEHTEKADEPDGALAATSKGKENTRKSSAGQEKNCLAASDYYVLNSL